MVGSSTCDYMHGHLPRDLTTCDGTTYEGITIFSLLTFVNSKHCSYSKCLKLKDI